MYLAKFLALALVSISTATACKCRDLDTRDPEWNVSYKCCKGNGAWIFKDCKNPFNRFGDCCRWNGYFSDC